MRQHVFAGARSAIFLAWFLASFSPGAPAVPNARSMTSSAPGDPLRSRHYEFHCDSPRRAELSDLLEASWRQFAKFLKAKPKLRGSERFKVRLFSDKDAWLEGVRREGGDPPATLDYLWYRPETNTVYLYEQDTPGGTRSFLIYGAWQQFHCQAKPKHRDLVHSWFVRGLGEHFATHRWDGKRLELGVKNMLSYTDRPAGALERLNEYESALDRIDLELLRRDPAVHFAMVRFLLDGENRKYRKRFEKLAMGETGSKLTGPEYAESLGDPSRVAEEFYDWLKVEQLPWQPVSGGWEEVEPRRLVAFGSPHEAAVACIKGEAQELGATVEISDPGASGGLVYAFAEEGKFGLARIHDGLVIVEEHTHGHVRRLAEFVLPSGARGSWTMEARRINGSAIALYVEGERVGEYDACGPGMGLASAAGEVRFGGLKWR